MNKVVGLLTLCVVCAILRAAVVALVVAMVLALLWSLITRPRETSVFLATCAVSCVAVAQPIACIVAVTVVSVVLVLSRRTRRPQPAQRLPGPR